MILNKIVHANIGKDRWGRIEYSKGSLHFGHMALLYILGSTCILRVNHNENNSFIYLSKDHAYGLKITSKVCDPNTKTHHV